MIDVTRAFFVLVERPRAETIPADAVARNLDRAGNIMNTSYIAPLGGPATMPSGPSSTWAAAINKHVDSDGDGRLTIVEAVKTVEAWFDQSDENHDGFLSTKELGDGLDSVVPR